MALCLQDGIGSKKHGEESCMTLLTLLMLPAIFSPKSSKACGIVRRAAFEDPFVEFGGRGSLRMSSSLSALRFTAVDEVGVENNEGSRGGLTRCIKAIRGGSHDRQGSCDSKRVLHGCDSVHLNNRQGSCDSERVLQVHGCDSVHLNITAIIIVAKLNFIESLLQE